jgi:hypothetical protein
VIGALGAALLRTWSAPRAARFAAALADCENVQRRTLARLVQPAAATEYAQQFGLHPDDDVEAFRAKLPPVDYATLEPWIAREKTGSSDILVPGSIRRFEPTSGSGGVNKLIPYNDPLLESFRSLFAIWAHDLLGQVLRLRSGRVFISVSPRLSPQTDARHDADYLSSPLRLLLAPFLVTPDHRSTQVDPLRFRDALARALLHCADLEIISIWSPTYLLVLLDHIEARREHLVPQLPAKRRRLLECDPIPWPQLWPRLQLVSCWSAAAAVLPAQELARRLPQALLQGKGLLATEAPVTVPLVQAGGCVPLVDEVFLELEDAEGSLCLLHQAQPDCEYTLLISQAGGLLRYRLGDRVRVTGHWRDTPLLDFVGRVDAVCDLVGEKLSEDQVAHALRSLLAPDAFAMLVPMATAEPPYYRLITELRDPDLPGRLDRALQAGHRYREARVLGQLAPLRLSVIADARRVVHDFLVTDGILAGDIKDMALLHSLARAGRLLVALDGIGYGASRLNDAD